MADVVLLIAVISLVSIFLILVTLFRKKSATVPVSAEEDNAQARANVAALGAARDQDTARFIRARRTRGRRPPPQQQQQQQQQQQNEEDEDDEEEEDPLAEHMALPDGKIGAKKRKKLEMKAEKRAQRERDDEDRQERKQRQILLDEQRKKDEEREKKEEARREEEEKQRKEELARQEHENYLRLKEAFTVEEEGYDETQTEKESQDLLQEFITYVKNTKVVIMEDLAGHFKLKTQEVIDRIHTLQESGQLSGVVDDRGKFIYISRTELESVAKFIKQRGRVSIAELVESSNKLINLSCST